jgi:UrcA family protein
MIMNTKIQTTFPAAAFLLCGAMTMGGLQATARAADEGLPKQTVSYADLDISKPAGAKALYSRIVTAARQVCMDGAYKDLGVKRMVDKCTDHAIDNAVRKVDAPELSALRPSSVVHFASN